MNLLKINKLILLYISIFIISRIIIFNYLNIQPSYPSGQIISYNFLKNELFESLLNLHFQPFLWNLFFGILAKLFSNDMIYFVSFLLNTTLTLAISYYFFKVLNFYIESKQIILIIIIFFTFNPNTVFYEHYAPHYAHFSLFMITQLLYFFLKFHKTRMIKFEIYSYLNLLILSYVWVLFSFLPLIAIFISFRFIDKKIKKENICIFLTFIILTFLPHLKNKIIFNVFTAGSWTGIQLAHGSFPSVDCSVFHYQLISDIDLKNSKNKYELNKEQLAASKKIVDNEMRLYEITFDRKIKSKIANSYESMNNNIGLIYRSKICLDQSIKYILADPTSYFKKLSTFFLVSHSKFAFEHDIKPKNWSLNFNDNKKLKKYKRIKQLLLIIYMIVFYYILITSTFKKKDGLLPNILAYFLLMVNLYVVLTSHIMSGYETERMMYTLFLSHLIVIAFVLKKIIKDEK